MLTGGPLGELELRAERDGGRRLSGRFPYGATATLSDGGRRGRPRKERFAPGAFRFAIEDQEREINLLVGHDFAKPLAARSNGTLALRDTDDALTFDARITPEVAETSHGRDALALIGAGLAVGLSPGFRIAPERTVPNAETVEEEDPAQGNALIRTIFAAVLFELSVVTRAAYDEATVEARRWSVNPPAPRLIHPTARWR